MRVKAVYLAIGLNLAGEKEVLGQWIAQTEGAKFGLKVVTELANPGIRDVFIACVDGLKGFPEAIEAVYPHAAVQLCVVHMVRHSLTSDGYTPAQPPMRQNRCSVSSKTNGTMPTCPSVNPGAGIGRVSRCSLTTRQRYGKLSTRPMRLNR